MASGSSALEQELSDAIIDDFGFPLDRLMTGHLAREGIIIPRAKLRASIHRVDPINTALRRSFVVRRRVYSVPGPSAVWHIDGHHKLIRWRFVTHGGIDCYSRTIVYHDNNRADSFICISRCSV